MRVFTLNETQTPLSCATAEEELGKLSKLKFEGDLIITSNNVKDFLKKEFFELNKKVNTIKIEDGSIDCEPDKDRSLVDIYRICKHYFPDCTIKEIREELLQSGDIATVVCHQVRRRVYYPFKKHKLIRGMLRCSEGYRDEFGWTLDEKLK